VTTYRLTGLVSGTEGSALTGPVQLEPLPQVLPLWGKPLHEGTGICCHPTFISNRTYQFTDQWFTWLLSAGTRTIRGMYNQGNKGSNRVLELCKANGVGWRATLIPEDYSLTDDQLRARCRHIKANALGVVTAVELMNEPNQSRDGTPIPDNWPQIMLRHAQIIRDELPDMPIICCSLHQQVKTAIQDHHRLGDTGIGKICASAGCHDYDGGRPPGNATDDRVDLIRSTIGPLPVEFTEYGYTNALENAPREHNPVSEEAAAAYAVRGILRRLLDPRGSVAQLFEILDDPGPLSNTEAHFGQIRTPLMAPSAWSAKPVVAALARWAGSVADDATAYSPPAVDLEVAPESPGVAWTVVGQSGGRATLWLWRPNAVVWDITTRSDITVDPIYVDVTTATGTSRVPVAGAAVPFVIA
jgi:hypothetical protein